jgi:16S rRNA (cytosine1402-N4)-methyltransferase
VNKNENAHLPVMPEEVLNYLLYKEGIEKIVDCTLGYGGHSSLILKNNENVELLGIDRDTDALDYSEKRLSFAEERVHLIHSEFSNIFECIEDCDWDGVDGVLMDLGVSSPQIDQAERGFSFRFDGPLDMRMNRKNPLTAARVLNRCDAKELADIFYHLGEIRESRKLARAVIERRSEKLWTGTKEFAELCGKVLKSGRRKSVPPATLCFQALRMYVNSELEELKDALNSALEVLKPGGRLVVISFHSLEDRIVKHFFKDKARECICPHGLPMCVCEHKAELKIITRKPIRANKDEQRSNPRASCAKLRVAEKI